MSLNRKKSPGISSKPFRQIGLNIGRSNLVGCEVLHRGGSIILERCARTEIQPNEQLSVQIKQFCEAIGFHSKRVNISLKGQGIVMRFLDFPRMSEKDFRSSIQYEAEKYLPFNISEVVMDHYILNAGSEQDKTMRVILVAAKKTEVEKAISSVKAAGLEINAIDIDILCCVNALEFNHSEIKEHVVGVLDLGAQDTTLCVVNHGLVVFTRDIAFGGSDMVEMLRRALGVTIEEAAQIFQEETLQNPAHEKAIHDVLERLFQELRLSLNYYFSQHEQVTKLDTFFLSGGLSQLKSLLVLLEQRMETTVERWDATEKMELTQPVSREILKPLLPYLPVCAGLAIRTK